MQAITNRVLMTLRMHLFGILLEVNFELIKALTFLPPFNQRTHLSERDISAQ